jgi:beta-lactamase class A
MMRRRNGSRARLSATCAATCAAATLLACAGPPPPVLPAPVPVPAEQVRPPQAYTTSLATLEAAVRERLATETGEFAVVAIDVETGRSFGINEHLVVHAASTMKVPVLLELHRRAAAGELRLDDAVLVRNRFRSIADTSHIYTLGTDADSEHDLHALVGRTTTLRDLARRMVVSSSNLATNILIDELGADAVQQTVDRVGGDGMRVLRGVEDGPAFRAGMNNTTTARGLASVLAAIARCDVLSRPHCDEMLDVLAAQQHRQMIPAGLPSGVRVAGKRGWITGIEHDAAVVMPLNSPPYVLVVLTRGAADSESAWRAAADISRLVWDALGPDGSLRPRWSPGTAELMTLHSRVRVPAFPAPQLGRNEYWSVLQPIIDASPSLRREEIGRSLAGAPIQLVQFGNGPTRVLLWSQMHGDETTASRTLTDIFNYIATSPDDPRVRLWAERLTILAVPMLNPDGADAHRRRGNHGIDINRDARVLATPEGRALKAVQQRFQPQYGFNLHDQNPRSRVGASDRIAAMALLAPPPDADATPTPSFQRALRLTAHIARTLAPLLGDHLTRFDDSYNARAFGDGMQSWGVSTVLIESGSWRRDDSKHFLRMTNFAALVSAFDAMATDALGEVPVDLYASLPQNGRPAADLLIRGGAVVLPGAAPYAADISIDARAVGGPAFTQVTDVGDLLGVSARDTLDATGLFIHPVPAEDAVNTRAQPSCTWPRYRITRGADPSSELVWTVDGVTLRQFSSGAVPVQ